MATVVVATVVASASVTSPGEAELANRSAAEEDARHLLEQLRVPPGASPSPTEPTGASPLLDRAPGPAWSKLIDLTSWWTVSGSPDEVLAWIEANPPQESAPTGGGGAVKLGDSASRMEYAAFDWPSIPDVLRLRSLLATVSAGPSGTTVLRADARVVWFLPRPASERIPASAHVVEVIEQRHRGDQTIATVSGPPVRRITALANGLPVSQPDGRITSSGPRLVCARVRSSHQMRLIFRAREGGPALAEAHQELPAEYCHPMNLRIDGENQPPLEGSYAVIRALRSALAVKKAGGS